MQGFLAYILPVGDGPPPGGGTPPGQPPGIWGGANEPFPTPPINLPGGGGGFPGKPPGIWGGGNEPFPTPPINLVPQPPIYVPPDHPPVIWGGGNEPFPTPPIVIPPDAIKPPSGTPSNPIELTPGTYCVQVYLHAMGGWTWVCFSGGNLPPTTTTSKSK